MCVCVCVLIIFFGGGGREGGEGASPVRVKDPILLIHGSLKESSPYKTATKPEFITLNTCSAY